MATPIRPEEVPKDLICSICLSVPLEPTLTGCSHVFCKSCIQTHFSGPKESWQNSCCPVCRETCAYRDLSPLLKGNPLAYRIWSTIDVKCEYHPNGCAWKGSLSDYESHRSSCPKASVDWESRCQELCREIQNLKAECSWLKEANWDQASCIASMQRYISWLEERNKKHREDLEKKNEVIQDVKAKVSQSIEQPQPQCIPFANWNY